MKRLKTDPSKFILLDLEGILVSSFLKEFMYILRGPVLPGERLSKDIKQSWPLTRNANCVPQVVLEQKPPNVFQTPSKVLP